MAKWRIEDLEKIILVVLTPGGTLKSGELWREIEAECKDRGTLAPSNNYIEKALDSLTSQGLLKVKKLSEKKGEDERHWTRIS